MTEQDLWKKLSTSMGRLWDAQRHEDSLSPDIPDVSYAFNGHSGWIELKSSDRVGKTPVAIPKLRPGQLNWMKRRSAYGAPCFIMWATNGELLILGANMLGEFDERRTMEEWRSLCSARPPLNDKSLIQMALKNTL